MMKNRIYIGLCASLLLHAGIVGFMARHLLRDDSANNQSVNSPIISMSIEMVASAAPAGQEQPVEPEPIPPPLPPEIVVAESPHEAKIVLNKPADKPRKQERPRPPPEKHVDAKPKDKSQPQKKPVEEPQQKQAEQTEGNSQLAGRDAVDSQAGARQATTSQPMTGVGADELQSYQAALRREIEKHKRYPRRAKKMKQQGIVQVRFSLLDSGDLTNHQLVQSSGADELDRAALAAIQQARSVGLKPAGLPKELTLAIEFNLK
ncbi:MULTISPECIES: energy transducer TonB [Photorhabdus]|uniref:energy transducer TonB n=2 Tax=Morganellaceae TaxID=1903414 RepID=UPI000DCCFDD1|nr:MULTISPECIES: energy transducer TonB [Photorhabdus]MCT8341985.1 energy transducer TonB [Photorhabdus kleinii]RAX01427.1 energy transducer TonB [Photorhabdus sp. S9-53]RAX01984.1 energy transducer TonB [Photorhabdus sp. S10-54]RAX05118.1 energy transducer TonB [Photorhabdus sp. S8-52]